MRLTALAAIAATALIASPTLPAAQPTLGALPATWQGDLPCADCAGIHQRLRLTPDNGFLLDLTYRQPKGGPDRYVRESGQWKVLPDGRLELLGDGGIRYVAPRSDGRLDVLDTAGRPINSRLQHPLVRDTGPDNLQTGIYLPVASGATMTLCRSGGRVNVATSGARRDLDQAYAANQPEAAAPLTVSFAGHLEHRAQQEVLVIDRLDRPLPGYGCPGTPMLHTMRWSLESLPGSGVDVPGGMGNPWIQFDRERQRIFGATGCNRLLGEYRSWGDGKLALLKLTTSRMSCPALDVENAFLRALSRVSRRVQAEDRLDLLSEDGTLVARLVAH